AEMAPGESCDALLRRADDALYVAKNEGRNRMRLAA
ncbi:MAG: diguanylate cyclase, partial [Lysobacteraceae bacterium]